MVNYPPYVTAYGKIEDVFKKIIEAKVPPKVTNDFLYTKLGLKSTSYRAMIPLLRKLGFIDQSNLPTVHYRKYRDPENSKYIMAERIRIAYADLFATNEYANRLKKEEIVSKLNTLLGTSANDKITPQVASTFLILCKLADFEGQEVIDKEHEEENETDEPVVRGQKLGLTYTINLNLPATTDIEVFNAIFKALKENLL